MVKIAILAAAGWKAAGYSFEGQLEGIPASSLPLETCPEPLLPLGSGKTILSRLVDQLRGFGFADIFAIVGEPGCLYPTIRNRPGVRHHTTEEQIEPGATNSPWTWPRVSYVVSLAIPLLTPDPDETNYLDGYARGLDIVGFVDWDAVLLMQADLLMTSELLGSIVNQEPSCYMTLHPRHDLFWLTPKEARGFRQLVEPHRRYDDPPLHEGPLGKMGIRQLQPSTVHAQQWTDVDYRSDFYRVTAGEDKPSWLGEEVAK